MKIGYAICRKDNFLLMDVNTMAGAKEVTLDHVEDGRTGQMEAGFQHRPHISQDFYMRKKHVFYLSHYYFGSFCHNSLTNLLGIYIS